MTGTGLAAALDGIDCAYYLIHSMEPARTATLRRPRPPGARRNFAEAAAGRRRRPGRSTSAGLVPEGRPPAAPRQPARGRARPARRGAGVGRVARLDRDRRALAFVSVPGAAGRAAAGDAAARLARAPHAADRRARRARVPRSPRRRAHAQRRPVARHRRARRPHLRRADRRIRDALLVRRPALRLRFTSRRWRAASRRRSPARTPSWSGR